MATFMVSNLQPRFMASILNWPAIILFNEKERKIAEEVVHRMVKRAVEMEGTVTGEHGVGLIKRDYLAHETSETTVDAMRKVSTVRLYNTLLSLTLFSSSSKPSTRCAY